MLLLFTLLVIVLYLTSSFYYSLTDILDIRATTSVEHRLLESRPLLIEDFQESNTSCSAPLQAQAAVRPLKRAETDTPKSPARTAQASDTSRSPSKKKSS